MSLKTTNLHPPLALHSCYISVLLRYSIVRAEIISQTDRHLICNNFNNWLINQFVNFQANLPNVLCFHLLRCVDLLLVLD